MAAIPTSKTKKPEAFGRTLTISAIATLCLLGLGALIFIQAPAILLPALALLSACVLVLWTIPVFQLLDFKRKKQWEAAKPKAPADTNPLKRNARLLTTLMEQMEEAVCISSPNSGKVHYVSPAFERLTKNEPEKFYEDTKLWPELIHGEDRVRVLRKIKQLSGSHVFDDTFRINLSSGVTRWVHAKWVPLKERSNATPLLACILTDITETRDAESRLKHEDLLTRSIIEKLPFPIFLKDEHLRFIACNGQLTDLHSTTPKAILNKTNFDFMPPEVAQAVQEREMKILQTGLPSVGEDEFEINGRTHTYKTYAIPIKENGHITKVLGYTKDVTGSFVREQRQRELNAQLARARRLESVGKLAGEVAHDLNNILGPIVAYPDLILEELEEDSPVREDVEAIRQSALDAASIIGDLLSLSRRNNYKLTPLDVNETLQTFLQSPTMRKLQQEQPEVDISVRMDEDLLPVMATPTNFTQILMNLIINAVDALHGQGRVMIESEFLSVAHQPNRFDPIEAGEYVVISIQDTGEGIPPEKIETVFEPFFTTKKDQGKGTGLGLSIVYGIVKDFNGFIDIQSTPGEGTTFTLYFPPTMEEIDTEEVLSHDIAGTESILVVDDIKAQRDLATRMLERLGYSIETADCGRAAIKRLLKQPYDLILLDMVMEDDFDGLDTLLEIRKMYPNVPVIIASGYSETERAHQAREVGISDYIRKPYLNDRLGLAVRRALDSALIKKAETLMTPPS